MCLSGTMAELSRKENVHGRAFSKRKKGTKGETLSLCLYNFCVGVVIIIIKRAVEIAAKGDA